MDPGRLSLESRRSGRAWLSASARRGARGERCGALGLLRAALVGSNRGLTDDTGEVAMGTGMRGDPHRGRKRPIMALPLLVKVRKRGRGVMAHWLGERGMAGIINSRVGALGWRPTCEDPGLTSHLVASLFTTFKPR